MTAFGNVQSVKKKSNGVLKMSEFDAYNNKKKRWETFSISKLSTVSNDDKYSNININEEDI